MEQGLFGFLGLLGLVIVLGVPYLLISHARLKIRVNSLERRLQELAAAADRATGVATDRTGEPASPAVAAQAVDAPAAASAIKSPWPGAAPPPTAPADSQPAPETTSETTPETALDPAPPRAFVFRRDRAAELGAWLRDNWVLAVAAASLALAGVFMVQYGVEHGLLTPLWRVIGALGFGAALIIGGEAIRRRHGDTVGATRHLPSTLSGAGLIVLFAGVLSARVMYGLIGPTPALAGLCAVSALAIVLGWFHGPVLAAVGLTGASAAPFLVGGQSDAPWIFYYYFALVALTGLAVDTVRRWAWVSVVALIAPLAGIWLLYLGDAGALHFIAASLIVTFAASILPERRLLPQHAGAPVLALLLGKPLRFAEFPTRLSLATLAAATAAALMVSRDAATPDQVWLALVTLMLLLGATTLWTARAPALADHALLPALAFLAAIALESLDPGPLMAQFLTVLTPNPETPPPATGWIVYTLVGLGALGSILAFWRMAAAARQSREIAPILWALGAAVFAPMALLILEFLWSPTRVTGSYNWALAAIALAALMTVMTTRCARATPEIADRPLRAGLFAVAALTLIALAIFLILAKTALTLALATMVLLTALLDRRFNLPPLGWFIQLGVAVISFRLIVDPGFDWATRVSYQTKEHLAPLVQVVLAYGGTLVLLAAAWLVTRGRRAKTALVLESALWTLGAVFAVVLLYRILPRQGLHSHWGGGLIATIWLASMVNQLYRLRAGTRFTRLLRGGLAAVFGLTALVPLIGLFTWTNPLTERDELVLGPPVFDTLAMAYLPLALVFAVAAWKLDNLHRWLRLGFATLGVATAAWYGALEIRRLWRGRDLTVPGLTDPELYSYTVALLLASVALLMLAFSRRSNGLRKLAMAGVALTIAKVFLLDMSGLSGLIRVGSFMGLGLALVGLAWLNRKMTEQWERGAPTPTPETPPDDAPDDTAP